MEQIITPDCPECGGEGSVPFDFDTDETSRLIHRRPCSACCKRWDDANPLPVKTDPRDAELAALRARVAALEAERAGLANRLEAALRDRESFFEGMGENACAALRQGARLAAAEWQRDEAWRWVEYARHLLAQSRASYGKLARDTAGVRHARSRLESQNAIAARWLAYGQQECERLAADRDVWRALAGALTAAGNALVHDRAEALRAAGAEATTLRAELALERRRVGIFVRDCDRLQGERDAAVARADRLRAALAAAYAERDPWRADELVAAALDADGRQP